MGESYLVPRQRRLTFVESYLVPRYRRARGRRSIAGIKESFEGYRPPTPMVIKEIPLKFRTCKTSAGVKQGYPFKIFLPASIFQRNPFKNFFHLIFFPGKSLYFFFQNHTFSNIFQKPSPH